jgi:raffinose/stachyose/melibiose transport system substrate-binding protein
MPRFALLCFAVVAAFSVTFALDIAQQRIEHPGEKRIVFVSMWAIGEPMQQAYEKLFQRFERRHPGYRVEPRWEGRLALPALRPRLLTQSDVPDILNTDLESLQVLVEQDYVEPLDRLLREQGHPEDSDRPLLDAIDPRLLERCRFAGRTHLIPSGVWLHLVFYNRSHYQQLGLEPPATWSAFLDNCRRLRSAGLTPFASDGYSYAQFWPEILLPRAVGEQTLRGAVLQGRPRFDEDPRFRAVFQAIRSLQQPGWFLRGWQGSRWPTAQRRFVNGEATHMINGSWLLRETLAYAPEPELFGAFPVPQLEGASDGARLAAYAEMPGYALIRAGQNREGAVRLLRFLLRRESAELLARVGREIPAVVGAAYPPGLEQLREHLEQVEGLWSGGIQAYAPRWFKLVFHQLYHRFWLHDDAEDERFLSVDALLLQLSTRTRAHQATVGERGARR